jgi:hypothetical protein
MSNCVAEEAWEHDLKSHVVETSVVGIGEIYFSFWRNWFTARSSSAYVLWDKPLNSTT